MGSATAASWRNPRAQTMAINILESPSGIRGRNQWRNQRAQSIVATDAQQAPAAGATSGATQGNGAIHVRDDLLSNQQAQLTVVVDTKIEPSCQVHGREQLKAITGLGCSSSSVSGWRASAGKQCSMIRLLFSPPPPLLLLHLPHHSRSPPLSFPLAPFSDLSHPLSSYFLLPARQFRSTIYARSQSPSPPCSSTPPLRRQQRGRGRAPLLLQFSDRVHYHIPRNVSPCREFIRRERLLGCFANIFF